MFSISSAFCQIQINPGVPAASLASQAFGNGISVVGEPQIECNVNQYGAFSNGLSTNLGISNGLIMSTGSALAAGGSASGNASTSYNVTTIDPQLTSISSGATRDVCIITFTLVPQCDSLALRFVFGSEEYPEFVGGNFNDVFGFFVSGPDPNGGVYDNLNVAILPNGTPVSINNVNASSNSSYYINNSSSSSIKYDGLTTVLTPSLTVTPCVPYTFKLAIADAGDFSYDSAIFVDFISCSTSVAIAQPSVIPSSCNEANGSVQVEIINGVGPFMSFWNTTPPIFSSSLNNFPAGTYEFHIFDQGMPCATTSVFPVVIPNEGEFPTTNIFTSDSIICQGESTLLIGQGADNFSWYNAQGTVQSSDVIFNASPNFSGYIWVDGSTLCGLVTDSIYLDVNLTPIPNPSVSPINCTGDSIFLHANTLFNSGNVTWFGPGGFSSNSHNPIISNVALNNAGVYYAMAAEGDCVSDLIPISVNVLQTPIAQPSTVGDVCAGDTLMLFANSGMNSYMWSGPSGFVSSEQNPIITASSILNMGEYWLHVANNGCISDSVAVQAVVNSNPSINLVPVDPICEGDSIVLIASSDLGTVFTWVGPNGFISEDANPIISNASTEYSGIYSVFSDAGDCSSILAQVEVTVNAIPNVSIFKDSSSYCVGEVVQLYTANTNVDHYFWVDNNGNQFNDSILSFNSDLLANGWYSLVLETNNCFSVKDSIQVVVYDIPIVNASAEDSTICENGLALLQAESQVSGVFNWSGPNGYFSQIEDPTIFNFGFLNEGIYQVINEANGCVSQPAQIELFYLPNPISIPSGTTSLCEGDNIALIANVDEGYQYSWSGPNGYFSTSTSPVIANAGIINSGDYFLTIIAGDCVSIPEVISVVVYPLPIAQAQSDQSEICQGDVVTISVIGLSNVNWMPTMNSDFSFIDYPSNSTVYVVSGNDTHGCFGADSISVTVINPMIQIVSTVPTASEDLTTVTGYLPLNVVFNLEGNVSNFSWDFGDSSAVIINGENWSEMHEYVYQGVFHVNVMGDLNGCIAVDSILVHAIGFAMIGCPNGIDNCDESFIPNIVTPNGDGENDEFWIPNVFLKTFHVSIYNRWGNLVGEISTPNEYYMTPKETWNPNQVEDGNYYYTVVGEGFDGRVLSKSGWFQITSSSN